MKKIRLNISLLLIFLSLSITGFAQKFNKGEASEDLSVLVDKKDASGKNINDGFIKLKVIGGKAPYNISFFSPYAFPSHTSGDQLNLENIKEGEYLVVIQDHSGKTLSTEIKIEIK